MFCTVVFHCIGVLYISYHQNLYHFTNTNWQQNYISGFLQIKLSGGLHIIKWAHLEYNGSISIQINWIFRGFWVFPLLRYLRNKMFFVVVHEGMNPRQYVSIILQSEINKGYILIVDHFLIQIKKISPFLHILQL